MALMYHHVAGVAHDVRFQAPARSVGHDAGSVLVRVESERRGQIQQASGHNQRTRIRRLALVIHVEHVEGARLMILNKACRLCLVCEMLIAHQDEVERLIAASGLALLGRGRTLFWAQSNGVSGAAVWAADPQNAEITRRGVELSASDPEHSWSLLVLFLQFRLQRAYARPPST